MTTSIHPPPEVTIPATQLHHLDASNIADQSYEIRMWLPDSYSSAPDRRYPVLYLTDGDHCFGMAVDIVRYLSRGGLIPEILIASVGYGSDRPPTEGGRDMRSYDLAPFTMEMSPQPRGDAFRSFLQDQLLPFVESTYRTDPPLRTFYGFSLGALFGLHEMLQSPRLFTRYILVSPALGPSTVQIFDLAERFVKSEAEPPSRLYLSIGELEIFFPWISRLASILDQRSKADFTFRWEVFPGGVHRTAPGEALAKGLRMALGRKSLYEAMYLAYKEGGIALADALYRDLKSREAPDYSFAENELNELGYMLLYSERTLDAVEVFRLNVEAFPDAWNAYDSLAEAYMAAGYRELATSNYEKSVELNPKNETALAQLNKLKRARDS